MVLGESTYADGYERTPVGGGPPNALTGTGSDPTHHVVLQDILGNEIGFIVTDQAGDLDERTLRRYPIADPAQPYVTEKQEAFSGFGQARWEDNRANYWWSEGVDTTKGQVVLSSRFRYGQSTGRDVAMHQPGDNDDNYRWLPLVDQFTYLAMPFTPSSTWSGATSYVKLWVKRRGKGGRLRVRVIQDSASSPTGTVRGTAYLNPSSTDVDRDVGLYQRIAITTSVTPQAATQYWVVVDGDIDITPSADNCWEIMTNAQSSSVRKSSDDSTYSSGANDFYYRLEGPRKDFTPRFYTYKGQMYFAASYDENYTSNIYMNGWRGVCDPNTTSTTKDSTQTDWATKITGDEVVRLMAGPRAGLEDQDWRRVTSGSSGVLNVSPDWNFYQTTYDDYTVAGSDYFTAIADNQAAPVLAMNITDVAVAEGIVYFCRGNNLDILTHREYNDGGTWRDGNSASDDSWKQASGVQAQMVQVLNDPISGPQLWFGENPNTVGMYQPVVCQSEPTTWENRALNFQSIIQHNGADEGTAWTATSGDVTVHEEAGRVHIDVLVGQLTVGGLSIANGGSTYNNGSHEFRVIEAGSSQGAGSAYAARIQCTVTAGVITAITAVNEPGHSYTKGATLSCEATGGGGAGDGTFTVNVNGVDGFATGQIAYANIVDTEGNSRSVDLRNMNLLALNMEYNTGSAFNTNVTADTLNDGDITFDLSSIANAASTYNNISVGGMVLDDKIVGSDHEYLSMDNSGFAQAASTIAVSLTLTVQRNRSFRLTLDGKTYALRDLKPIPVGNLDFDNITNLQSYGDPEALWVATETGLGEIRNNLYMPLPQRELRIARHPNNGAGIEVSDVYLLFTWRGRLQRYFRQNLEDLGPDFPFELGELEGDIVDIITYPGRVYVAVDGGDQGRSMVLCHKGGGWHEVYTGFSGERIRGLYIQSIPGKSDKLWWGSGSDLMYTHIALDPAELPSNNDYKFRGTGYLTSSWVYTAHSELNKLFRSMVVTMQRANDSNLKVTVQYQLDDEDNDWQTTTKDTLISASAKEFFFGDLNKGQAKSGNRIRVRLVLETLDASKSPVVRSLQHKMYRLPEVKFAYTFLSKISSLSINLRGDEEKVLGTQASLVEALAIMDNWAQTVMPLTVISNVAMLHEKLVILEPLPTQLLMIVSDEDLEEESIQVALNDA